MARALRRPGVAAGGALALLVGASVALHWLAGQRNHGLWIMPDEAIYGFRALQLWDHGSLPVLRGQGAGYSVLYPVVAGGPLSVGGRSTGYDLLKPVQALVMSLAALPVFFYGRRLMPAGYALVAAALTLASPLLLFSGFLMTEVVYYPVATVALVAIARAVETAALRDQALALLLVGCAIATRVQAVVLVLVFGAAILVDAAFAARRPRLRAFWPLWGVLGAGLAAGAAAPTSLGAYSSTLSGGYSLGRAVRLVYDHLAYVPLEVGVVPAAALVVLLGRAARGRERDPAARALLAVTACAIALIVCQVGVFASRYSPHILGRDLAALPPLLFLCFALWLARGAPRPRVAASVTAIAVLAVLIGPSWDDLSQNALPDSMGLALLVRRYFDWTPQSVVAIGAALLLVAFRFVPRRLVLVLPAAVLGLLTATSVVASNLVTPAVNGTQLQFVGTPRTWIGQAAGGRVAYVYAGDTAGWPVVWQQRFWNPSIDRVVAIEPATVPGPIPERRIVSPPDGVLPISERYVVANDGITMVGTPVAHQSRGPTAFGLTLWRLAGAPRLSTVEHGFAPNGDLGTGRATVRAFGCAGGDLQLTLLPKLSHRLEIDLDGRPVVRAAIGGLPSWHGTIPVPRDHGAQPCTFAIRGDSLLGSTVVLFERPSS